MRFFRCQAFVVASGGSISFVFAAIVAVLFMCIGVALDFGRADTIRQEMQAATDAAALAAANDPYLSEMDVQKLASTYMTSDSPLNPTWKVTHSTTSKTFVEVVSKVEVPTAFSSFFGIDSIPVRTTARAAFIQDTTNVQAADMSGSMGLAADASTQALMIPHAAQNR